MPSQALADTLPLAPASLLQGNQNSSSDGAGWEDGLQKPEFRENSTSMALFPQCYERYIFISYFTCLQQVSRCGP